jgi:transcriptional regulator with XRE-family HTH domain
VDVSEARALVIASRLSSTGAGRDLRLRARLSVRDVAGCVGVDAATLSRWERGQCHPRRAAAVRWVEVCAAIDDALRAPIPDGTNDDPGVGAPGSHEDVAAKQVLAADSTASEGADEHAP